MAQAKYGLSHMMHATCFACLFDEKPFHGILFFRTESTLNGDL
jgi:hypothetical protein